MSIQGAGHPVTEKEQIKRTLKRSETGGKILTDRINNYTIELP